MSSVFFNKGENCIAAGRLFVARGIHDEFVKRVVAEISKMVSFLNLYLLLFILSLMSRYQPEKCH